MRVDFSLLDCWTHTKVRPSALKVLSIEHEDPTPRFHCGAPLLCASHSHDFAAVKASCWPPEALLFGVKFVGKGTWGSRSTLHCNEGVTLPRSRCLAVSFLDLDVFSSLTQRHPQQSSSLLRRAANRWPVQFGRVNLQCHTLRRWRWVRTDEWLLVIALT